MAVILLTGTSEIYHRVELSVKYKLFTEPHSIYKDRRMGMEIFNTVCPTNILLTKVKKLRKQ